MSDAPHHPVLIEEALEYLRPAPDSVIVDATFGAGGHSRQLLARGARVIAVDQDPDAAKYAAELSAGERLTLITGNFRFLSEHLRGLGLERVNGILCDLGVSSMQLDQGDRGFAFRQEGPLDMRMGEAEESAADVVNGYDQEDLAAIIFRYGEERHSRRIARAIAAEREREPIVTTGRLAQIIASAYPGGWRREHPARRTFQALRIHVNDELGALQQLLDEAPTVLAPAGRMVVISYHSLEDRLVKRAFKDDQRWQPLTRKPVVAGDEEVASNPRARSAKLRAAERSAP